MNRAADIDLDDPAILAITGARVKLLFGKPFFGQLATQLEAIDASKWCKTAATDGRRLYYNRQFILDLDDEQLLFLIGHEVLHCVLDHLGRRGHRDPKLWNMANDFLVNYILVSEKVGVMPQGGLYDAAYTDELSSEEIYDLLEENSVEIQMTLDEHLELGGDESDEDRDGKGKGEGDGEGEGEGDPDGEGGGKNTVKVKVIGKDGPPKLSDDDLNEIRNELKAAVIRAAQAAGSDKVPLGIRRLIDDLIEPKMDWRTLLDAHIRSSVKDDYTFQRISRRSWGSGFILPGQDYADTVECDISIDASGSLTEAMLRDFLSEVKGIMETFGEFKIRLWTFDTEVKPESFAEFGPENIDDIYSYQPHGGGGTLFEANWEFMKREGIEPARFVMFTDGLPNQGWGDPDYCDTLFVIHGNTTIKAPFGLTAYYDEPLQAPTEANDNNWLDLDLRKAA